MSQNNQEHQTNVTLTTQQFETIYEPKLIQLLQTGNYEQAQNELVDVLAHHSMEPELRTELLFSVACCQYQVAKKFQEAQHQRGKEIAQRVGITQIEAATVKGMLSQWIKSQIAELQGVNDEAQSNERKSD